MSSEISKKNIVKDKTSKRGLPVYKENPTVIQINTGKKPKRLTNDNKTWVSEDTGECFDRAGLYEVIEVDNAPFVKLYIQSVRAFAGLTKTAGRVLEVVMHELKPDQDKVYLSTSLVEDYAIAESTFFRGVKELCERDILFESSLGAGWYFINVNFMFNGDRLIVAKEYRRKRGKFQDPNQLKLL